MNAPLTLESILKARGEYCALFGHSFKDGCCKDCPVTIREGK